MMLGLRPADALPVGRREHPFGEPGVGWLTQIKRVLAKALDVAGRVRAEKS